MHTTSSKRHLQESFFYNLKRRVTQEPYMFILLWLAVFTVTFTVLWSANLVPELLRGSASQNTAIVEDLQTVSARSDSLAANSAPVRIIIDRINVDSAVANPQSRDIEVLNDALQEGVVHYPGSGSLEDTTNMFLFGHSTGFRVVRNDAYKVFNRLDELEAGDVVRMQSGEQEYRYKVVSVSLVDADEAWVTFRSGTKRLTLSTCNIFGQQQERFVVEADFIGSVAL